jgi:hypothetical protein
LHSNYDVHREFLNTLYIYIYVCAGISVTLEELQERMRPNVQSVYQPDIFYKVKESLINLELEG